MNRLTNIVLLIIILFAFNAQAQNKKFDFLSDLKGPVHFYSTHSYIVSGDTLNPTIKENSSFPTRIEFNKKGEIMISNDFRTIINGQEVKYIRYNEFGEIDSLIEGDNYTRLLFEGDKIIQYKTVCPKDNRSTHWIDYKYNSEGKLIEESKNWPNNFDQNKTTIEYLHDTIKKCEYSAGKLKKVELRCTLGSGEIKILSKQIITFKNDLADTTNQIISSYYNEKGWTDSITILVELSELMKLQRSNQYLNKKIVNYHDAKGNVIRTEEFLADGELGVILKYEFDEYSNMTRVISIHNGEIRLMDEFEYVYYEKD